MQKKWEIHEDALDSHPQSSLKLLLPRQKGHQVAVNFPDLLARSEHVLFCFFKIYFNKSSQEDLQCMAYHVRNGAVSLRFCCWGPEPRLGGLRRGLPADHPRPSSHDEETVHPDAAWETLFFFLSRDVLQKLRRCPSAKQFPRLPSSPFPSVAFAW